MPGLLRTARPARASVTALASTALASIAALASCDHSDNVSWYIRSTPSAGWQPVQGGLVVSWRYSSKHFSIAGGALDSGTPAALKLVETGGADGRDPAAWREIYLAVDSDAVVTVEPGRTQIHSPAFPDGARTILAAVAVLPGPDPATALRLGISATETVHVAAAGNLVLVEGPSGVTAWRTGQVEQVFPAGSAVEPSGPDFLVVERSGRITRIVSPPTGPIGGQVQHDAGRDSFRFHSFERRLSAELPASRFDVRDGSSGIHLDGDFPDGAGGASDGPFRAILPARNHHLLLLRRAP